MPLNKTCHFPSANHLRSAHQGISLLLALSVLGGLIFVTSAATDMILTVSRSSRSIGDSEIAYFAAETAVERALWQYEKNSASLGALTATATPLPGNPIASYTTSATTENHAPKGNTSLSVSSVNDPITTSNPLQVTLLPGKVFYLDLATNGAAYPTNVQVTLPTGKPAEVIVTSSNVQTQTDYMGTGIHTVTVDSPSYTNNTKLKIENTDTTASTYTITPTGSELPIGVLITGIGRYRGVERRLEVVKPNWVIY
ncbi:MAG: hypothetical protein WC659_05930 [Patescibacteria group bacterium]